jgi:hypothetical protein
MQKQLPLLLLHEPVAGKARAINMALDHLNGELVVFTDDDVRPGYAWVKRTGASFPAISRRWNFVRSHPSDLSGENARVASESPVRGASVC